MSLGAGTRLGPYEILAPLGAGGMGEVYKARDTRLTREVAIKVLPSHRAPTPEARERFEREARTISRLSHPHICILHDVGREGDVEYLVMELLEGETLADRLGRGALPVSQSTRYGAEIASALDAAHRRGIVHRDLKPGNVMLTKDGVKLLDFGLARGFSGAGAAGELTAAPTVAPLTADGAVVGTVAYMAPEQLEGKEADARTDIFALGNVLYEMVTGRKAFAGPTQATVISAILTSDPPSISSLQPVTPPELDRLVRTCLAKDPAERWQSAHDVELQLRAVGTSGSTSLPAAVPPRNRRRAVPWVVAAIAALTAALVWIRGVRSGPTTGEPIRFAVLPPENGAFVYNVEGEFLAVSPDGKSLAFVASGGSSAPSGLSPVRETPRGSGEAPRVWIRSLDRLEPRALAGTEGAQSLLWSPDGRSLAFFTSDKLKRVDLPGGTPVTLCDVPPGGGVKAGTWGRRMILFTSVQGGALYSVPPSGGSLKAFAAIDPSHPELRYAWPQFLSDGERYLYLVRDREGWGNLILAGAGKPARPVTRIASCFQVIEPGYLLHVREGTLLAQPFDEKSGRVTGDPVAVADGVRYFYSTAGAGFAARAGTIAYQAHRDLNRLAWFDRSGKEIGRLGASDEYGFLRFAPDGKRLFFDRTRPGLGTLHIWSFDLDRGMETAVTNGQDTEAFPLPLADGKTMIYGAVRGTPPLLMRRDLASGEEQLLAGERRAFQVPQDVSPDGRTLVYTERGELGNFDIWSLALDGSSPPNPLVRSSASKGSVRFSPDGRYLAFLSSESGQLEVYVMPFPGPGEKVRISEGGASQVRWAPTGELFYSSGDRSLVAVPIKTSPRLEIGTPEKLFQQSGRPWNDFDVTRDGRRFLAIVPERVADEEPLDVIVNWAPPAR